jgi:branched-chain amino acid transport system permease protein
MGYAETIFVIAGFNIILALSVFATLSVGQFSLAQVGFWAIGAYVSAILTTLFSVPYFFALLCGAAVCAFIAVLVGYPCLRIKGMYLALATLGFSESMKAIFSNLNFQLMINGQLTGPDGVLGFRNIAVQTTIFDVYIFIIFLIIGFYWLTQSRLGEAIVAIRDDEVAAQCAGIDIVKIKVGVFALGGAIAGVGGGMYANYMTYIIASDFNFHLTLVSVLFVALGGIEIFWGPILGALLLTIIPEYIRFLQDYRMIFYGIVVMVIMLLRPKGLIDMKTVKKIKSFLKKNN